MAEAEAQRIWIPPLPAGYEARYDHNQRRYFFINHVTKRTQWDDPRFSSRPTSTSAASSLAHNSAGRSFTQQRAAESVPMKELSPRHSSQRGSHQTQEESSLTRQVNNAAINKLHREFPRATKELITDMFQLCHENVRETREQLKDLGFLQDNKSPQHQPSQQSHQNGAQRQAAAKPELSESQKRQLVNQLKSQFPKLDDDVINLALTSCNYGVNETKDILKAWEQRQSTTPKTSASSSSATGTASTSSASQAPRSMTPASLEPASLSSTDNTRPQPLNDASGRGASPSRQPPQMKARHVTKKKASKTPRKKETVVTSQPTRVGHVTNVSRQTVAKGPDAGLRKGPDSSLIRTDYEAANGPDRNLRQGPDHSRVLGPLGGRGADPSLRCGPQSSILQGHMVSSQPLVTNI